VSALAAATELAGYRIEEVIGRGGMGVVYSATQMSLNRKVALKVLAAHLSDDDVFRERFRREGMLQASIENPHAVPIIEAGESEHGLYIAMRLIKGSNLKTMIESGALTSRRSIRILAQAAEALDAAHTVGIVHRDVKPQNILVEATDYAYLADFGLTKAAGFSSLTRSGLYVGTLDYVSPEQIRGEELGPPADIYALGVVLYECLAGEVPFERESEAALLFAHVSDPPPHLHERRSELPPAIDGVVAQALAKDPKDRFATAVELISAAESALAGTGDIAAAIPAMRRGEMAMRDDSEPALASPEAVLPRTETVLDRRPALAPPDLPAITERRSTLPVKLGVIGALAAVAAAVGFLVGHGHVKTVPAATHKATANGVALELPVGWTLQKPPKSLGVLKLQALLAAGPPHTHAALLVGLSQSASANFIPSALAKSATGLQPDIVRFSKGMQAFRYRGLLLKGAPTPLTVYAASTSKGALALICLGTADMKTACEATVDTVALRGISAYPLAPSRRYAATLNAQVTRLNRVLIAAPRSLRKARKPSQQAVIATSATNTLRGVASALHAAHPQPRDKQINAALVASINSLAADYDKLAAAAQLGNTAAYDTARVSVAQAVRELRKTLSVLAANGYVQS
jgi:predicted Ser/Thr protein kinase